jgi:hypothetical protein
MLRPTVSRPVCLGVRPSFGPKTRFLLPSDSCDFVDVGRPLWWENGYNVYNCCWSSPAQSFSGPNPAGLMTTFYSFRFEIPLTWKSRSSYLYPPGRGGPVIPPGTDFPFRLLLLLAELQWRYSNPPPRGLIDCSNCPPCIILARITQKTPFLCFCFQLLPCKHACMRCRYSVTTAVFLLISRSLSSNGCTCYNMYLHIQFYCLHT